MQKHSPDDCRLARESLPMSLTITSDTQRRAGPRLRLLSNDAGRTTAESTTTESTTAESTSGASTRPEHVGTPEDIRSVLVAGADSCARSRMLAQLRGVLPDGTQFVEAGETWEVVARASDSRMVVLTGDLGDLTAPGLMRVLSRRHPLLPVVALHNDAAVDARQPAVA
jgi:hypothetical protein